ncbi:metalloregulator ArsR/SmtB family transcription factor [Thalassobacillus sp. C254]|uniref:helix-turn-helix transcriptional regulator n=1 Tax=Thalassobacillus sp. C254 TaxID=1225341 RepID=UPI0006D0575E|nr:helix-turn-helix domain-containing protein [Thalassobacillus sp. C254]
MEQNTLKVTSVLADPTRFSIYQYVAKQHREVTVQEVAEVFDIHVNVARLHLTKLESVSLLASETKKTGKGGRPSRCYYISDQGVHIQFPFRDYHRLAVLAMESLASFGEEGQLALNRLGHSFGKEAVLSYLKDTNTIGESLDLSEKMNVVEMVAAQQGLNPELSYDAEEKVIHFQIYNCPFKELLPSHSGSLCNMHHALMKGMFEGVFQDVSFTEQSLMDGSRNSSCSYTAVQLS